MGNKIIIGVLALVALVGLFLPIGNESKTIVERVSNNLGAVNSPDLNIGGVRLTSAQTGALNQATSSVLCALQSPAATSSLVSASIVVTTATSGASSLSLTKGTTAGMVGSVILATTSIASGAQGALTQGSSTPFAPNTYLIGAQGGAGILNQSGSCNAVWMVL